MVEKGHEVSRDALEQTAPVVEQTTEQSMAAVATAADPAGIWRELATAQFAHNVEVFQKLVAARDWPEQLAIQQGYLRGNVARLIEATSCSMALTESMLGQWKQRRGNATERPARA